MIANADITIYNLYMDRQTKKKEYRPTQIRGVHWYTDQKVQLDAAGGSLRSADLYKIRIYENSDTQGREYIDAIMYRKLPPEQVDNYWTVDNGDFFVKGLAECPFTELENHFAYVGKVNSFSDNRKGFIPHIRIGGAR